MRRLTAAAVLPWLAAAAIVLTVATPAAAQPEPTEPADSEPAVPEPIPGEPVCTVTDTRLRQLSGLVATDDGYFTANDGSGVQGVFALDSACQPVEQFFYESLDPEDMELDRDGDVLWVADTGDNFETANQDPRGTVALWRIDLAGDRTPLIHRFSYEDGQPRDAEALLLDSDGTPLIVTKAVGLAEIFRPVDLVPNNPHEQAVTLEKLGELSIPETGTEHDRLPSTIASRAVTGGAVAPDGSRVVLRTYTDALEFDVTDGDIVGALVDGEPRVTPLPGEPQGEAITYTPDGSRFVTVSEAPDDLPEYTPELLSYAPTAPAPEPTGAPTGAPAAGDASGGGGLFNSVQDIINLIAAIGVFGLLLVAAGIVGIVRARRRAAAAPEAGSGEPVTGRARLGGDRASGAAGAVGAAGVAGAAAVGEPGGGPGGAPREQAGGVYTSSAVRPGEEYPHDGYGGGYGGEYQSGGYDPAGYQGGQYAGDYQGGQYAGGQYPAGGYPPEAGYAGEGYHPDGYGGAGYGPAGQAADGYGGAAYGGDYPAGGHGDYPAGGHGGYPAGYGPGGRPDQPYDQDWSGHPAGDYPQPGYEPGAAADYGQPAPGGGYGPAPDDYSDDPDYPYEFRQPGRW